MTTDNPSLARAAKPPAARRAALVDAISRRRRRMRLRLGLVGAAGVVVVAVTLGLNLLIQGPSPALAIDSDAGPYAEVRMQDGQAGADEMTSELQDAGINAEVRLIPAEPGSVGHWMGFLRVDPPVLRSGEDPRIRTVPCLVHAPPPLFASHEGYVSGDLLAIRRDAELADARWIFYVGREPQADEQPQIVSAAGPIPVDPQCEREMSPNGSR